MEYLVMRPLSITRFKQDPNHCSISASASVANFYNPDVNYSLAKHVCAKEVNNNTGGGLWSGEVGLLLNHLGFKKVTIITSDLSVFDYSWAKYSNAKMSAALKEVVKKSDDGDANAGTYIRFLNQKDCCNNVIIDYNWSNRIRSFLDKGNPLLLSFNWTMFFRYSKGSAKGKNDPYGDYEEHVVAARGYNEKGVHIVDSHYQYYKYRLKEFRKGYYLIPWEILISIIGQGDLYLPEDYDKEGLGHELV